MIFGKPLSEYVAFAKLFLCLLAMVGVARLALRWRGWRWGAREQVPAAGSATRG